ncbi:unnamed protein product [Rhizophagus irregularis]|uniref:DNA polymerase n=1 Tax=Rhizophagus irregularis TaxID=588596 RepID=A0A915ZWF5_9GLOM|nr:unnamed protein product [Rhizophagus irregularis]CAB5183289.1 unnamed protein product [Rhizophagus irregularis]CAB5390882.1 unnamed protein product [Rhizophagus irregularis]
MSLPKRRAVAKSNLAALQTLRRLRQEGGSRLQEYEVQEPEVIYDEVTEEIYQSEVKKVTEMVVNDDGTRYITEELDDLGQKYADESEYEEDPIDEKRKRKGSENQNDAKPNTTINNYFLRAAISNKLTKHRSTKSTKEESEFMSDLLQRLDDEDEDDEQEEFIQSLIQENNQLNAVSMDYKPMNPDADGEFMYQRNQKRVNGGLQSYTCEKNKLDTMSMEYTPLKSNLTYQEKVDDEQGQSFNHETNTVSMEYTPLDSEVIYQEKIDDKQGQSSIHETDKMDTVSMEYIPFDSEFTYQEKVDDKQDQSYIHETNQPDTASMDHNKPLKLDTNSEFIYQTKNDKKFDQSFIQETIPPINDQSHNCYRLFWIDAVEKFGIVYIIGKVFNNESKTYISCCATVKNIHRNVFILPRQRKLDEHDNETEIDVTMEDVSSEVNDIFKKKFRDFQVFTKPVNRKYGFELPDIPTEAQYLKVTYPFTQDSLPRNLSGKTFTRAFGTNTSALELFILKRKIKGPCWLEIKDAIVETSRISWCKLELVVDDPKKISILKESNFSEPIKSPSLTTMSLSLRTIMNHKKQVNEIAAFSVRFYPKVPLDEAVTPEKLQYPVQYSAIRQLNDKPWWTHGFEELVEKERKKGLHLNLEANEYSLINYLLALIKQYDPDVFIGHNFIGFDLDVLLHRLKELKIKDWSCLGRLRRVVWPKSQSGSTANESSFVEKSIVNGRLICDTYLNAKDLVKSKNYSLTELVLSQLGKLRKDIEYDKIPMYYSRAKDLLDVVCHCWNDAIFTAELMFKLQILPLTKQLTNLAGNIWSKTLIGSRADRNEFLLLHEFHQHKYICPDKEYKKIQEQISVDGEDESTETKASGRRKPTYAGGLVLEPKKGFYDNYVVLLDFNSLYPSIIQEYNICFTTVVRVGMEKNITPEIPDSSLPQGILPKLIAKLVERRRMVKNLMKSSIVTSDKLAEYDIRQKALKLTANSMYGCLGYTYSRFYAKPLAMLITFKGREILENTVKLAENEKMEVIYGDTDSIMINTKAIDINQALEVGNILKKKVNERYKLLELEIDGFFEKLLLLKKKKYAAIVVEKKNGILERSCETKGLDLVRRDWCDLVNKVSRFVLDQILSSHDREVIVNTIHAYLRQVGEDTRSGNYPINSFIINKNLAKSPEAYTDAKIQPHVQVALRMKKKGLSARTGDFIPYVICLTADGKEFDKNISDRAFHPDEINESDLRIDYDWYLKIQIHASVSRLCGHIEGIDNASIAECLGFDPSKFKSSSNLATSHKIGSKMPDGERFKDVEKFMPICIHCNVTNIFEGLKDSEGLIKCNGCNTIIPFSSILTQLTFKVRSYIKQYYDGWKVCDEQSCLYRTRQVTYSKNCINRGCNGKMKGEYDEQKLYLQLLYLSQLFDISKVQKRAEFGSKNIEEIGRLKSLVDRHLDRNALRYVNLGELFNYYFE